MHGKICIACFENYSINHTSVDLITVAAQSRYTLRSRNATLLVPANARCLPTDLVTEPFSQQLPNCGTVFGRRQETFRALLLLRELSKPTFLR